MHMVAIGWLFVALMMAVTETSVVAGILSFLFYGVLPLALFWWVVGAPARRARSMRVRNMTDKPDRADAEADQ